MISNIYFSEQINSVIHKINFYPPANRINKIINDLADKTFTDVQNNLLMIALGDASTSGTFIFDANSYLTNTDTEITDVQEKVQNPIDVVSQYSNKYDANYYISTIRRSGNTQNTYTFTYSGCI